MGTSVHAYFLVLGFLLSNLVPLEYAEGKQTSYACEGSILRLDCEPGRVIHLIRAIYGRFSITICNENGKTEWSVNCGSPKSILVLNGTCNYQRSCSVMASTKTFGDPCPGTVKYLEVQYQCIPESQLTSTTPRSLTGRQSLKSPWLSPSSPNLYPGGSGGTESGLSLSSSPGPPPRVPHEPNKQEEPLEGLPYPGGNQSTQYSSISGYGGELEGSSVIVLTTGAPVPSTPPPPSSSSTSAVRSEPSPLLPPKGGPYESEFPKSWAEGDGSEVTETSYRDWVDRPADENESGFSNNNMDVKWSERLPGSEGTQRPHAAFPTQNSHHGSRNGYEDEGRGRAGVSRPSPGRNIGKEFCESKLDRGMFWNWTSIGGVVRQPCPGGASGTARWKCILSPQTPQLPSWYPESPDLSDCKSAWLSSLQARVLEPDQVPHVLAGELAQVTSTKQMYGGDIAAAVKIMKTIASRQNEDLRGLSNQVSREDLAADLLQLILDAGSNLLEKSRFDPWKDLSFADKMANATGLLVGLEDNAFLLANVVTSEKTLRKAAKNILTTIYAIEASNVREINFPSESSDHWGRMGDVLTMPAEALRENSDGGLIRLVCFAYNNLEQVLQPTDPSADGSGGRGKFVNSRVISASLNQGRHIQLALPVQLTFRHLLLDTVSNAQCVFWDYTTSSWSEEGCRVVKTNRTHTECQCTHLTNFAILMDLSPPPKHLPPPQLLQVVMYVGSAVVILCLVFTLIITHFCIHGKVFQTMILKNLFLCMLIVELIFVFGIHATHKPWMCTSIAVLQHYFALASILWLFLHGFHLHLIVVEAAESGLSRQLWYYGVSYGSPAIVVLLSFLLDSHGYRSESYCWIQTTFGLLCFVGPAVVVALATAAVLVYTSYRVCGLLSAMPKKPNDDKALYTYAGTWLRGSLLILVFMTFSWTLRLIHLDSDSTSLAYAASLCLALQGIAILVFHSLKSEDMIAKLCDCGRGSDSSETEMSTHSQQQLQGGSGLHSQQGPAGHEACHNNHLVAQQRAMDGSCLLTLSRQPVDVRNHESLYSKQLAGVSPGGVMSGGLRYGGDVGGVLGLYSKGLGGLEGSWTRGSSYSDIRSMGYHHRTDPVYEEIEKPLSPRASVSDLSEDEANLYPHELDLYNRSLYGQHQARAPIHYHPHRHVHHGSRDRRKGDLPVSGDVLNPLLVRPSQLPPHAHSVLPSLPPNNYTGSRHRTPSDQLHHVSLKGLHPDEHILQNVHMV